MITFTIFLTFLCKIDGDVVLLNRRGLANVNTTHGFDRRAIPSMEIMLSGETFPHYFCQILFV
jgi:hypothetical protein